MTNEDIDDRRQRAWTGKLRNSIYLVEVLPNDQILSLPDLQYHQMRQYDLEMKSIPCVPLAAPTWFDIMKSDPQITIPSNKAANPNAMKIPECCKSDGAVFRSYHNIHLSHCHLLASKYFAVSMLI